MQTKFEMPPRMFNREGNVRRVGFEFEYTGVGLNQSAQLVAQLTKGQIQSKNRFSHSVIGGRLGDFQIESDSSMLTKRKWEKFYPMMESIVSPLLSDTPHKVEDFKKRFSEKVEEWVEFLSEDVIPFEIVTPPIPLTELAAIEDLRESLYNAGARGTKARFFAAYGMQFNPEMPDFEVSTLLGYMRAFFLLYDRMLASEDVPLARKALPFINPFPHDYVEMVLNDDYDPTLEQFMHDYLRLNPTRNRALDWLPLFAYINKELTFSYPVEVNLIKPRPTLHYRLPSSLIDDPKWTIAEQWNKWIEVERLANNPAMIRRMSAEWREIHGPMQFLSDMRWVKRSGELLHGRA